ncbi:hypothetical protein B0H98_106186 [Vreelandella songnenensis]|uniref:Uncharacterized protein n=1 Tax=Vreelandella songnenensis TaxID=1176243 RepID=A0A2T0V289_9GAMM|nr:hypothetical protein [Halomonas songnenensis]PRY64274.1 hypothetical protein B0H98_106186 [Halomonas songnenensis]
MKRQRGAALVVVMGLLSVALMIGVASLRSALVDERLAGNYRALVQTQMVEESLLAAAAGNTRAAQRDILFDRLAATLGRGEQFVIQGEALGSLLSAGTLSALARQWPFDQQDSGASSLARIPTLVVQKLDGSRLAVLTGRQVAGDTQPQAQLVFVYTDTAPRWQLARLQ